MAATRLESSPAGTSRHTNPHVDGRYIPILDGWRAVAILLVLLFHGLYNTHTAGHPFFAAAAAVAGKIGALGVLIFFCISGYLITRRLRAESRETGAFSLRAFYIKRLFRIVPPLAVYLLVIGGLSASGVLSLRTRDWSSVVFLTNYLPGSWYTAHFWSLSVEEHFYLFWPLCVIAAGWRRAAWVGVALICLVAAWRPWELHHAPGDTQLLQHTDMRLDYIMMGCVVALAVEYSPRAARILTRSGSSIGLAVLLVALGLSTRLRLIDVRTLQAAILTLMVCGSSLGNARLPKLLLANPFMLLIGKISYSLYIWQELFLGPTRHLLLGSPWALPFRYGAAFVAAYLSYRLVERPCIQYGRNLLAR